MTKQEKIREGIDMKTPIPQAINKQLLWLLGDYQKYLKTSALDPNYLSLDEYLSRTIRGILLDLNDLGVVIKVGREKYRSSSGSLIGMALARGVEGGEMLRELKNLMDAIEPLVEE